MTPLTSLCLPEGYIVRDDMGPAYDCASLAEPRGRFIAFAHQDVTLLNGETVVSEWIDLTAIKPLDESELADFGLSVGSATVDAPESALRRPVCLLTQLGLRITCVGEKWPNGAAWVLLSDGDMWKRLEADGSSTAEFSQSEMRELVDGADLVFFGELGHDPRSPN